MKETQLPRHSTSLNSKCLSVSSLDPNSKSLNLVRKTYTNKLVLNQEALDFISNIKEDIGVCVCIGPLNQGKSFMLNQLMMCKKGLFKVGRPHEPYTETQGVYLSKLAAEVQSENSEPFKMILLDTEVFFF
jgi:hypothetical protein